MKRSLTIISLVCSAALLAGCGDNNQHRDLKRYIEETKNRPQGEVEPLPMFRPYRPYAYSAMTLRSPFDPPMREEERAARLSGVTVQPDFDREPEYLENFSVTSLAMVGTLLKDGQLWVLVDDGQGGVHPVTVGNYLGKNHGRIVAADRNQIELMEIVADGGGGWVERPRIIELRQNG